MDPRSAPTRAGSVCPGSMGPGSVTALTTGPVRLARALAVAALLMVTAVAGHLGAGGAAPTDAALVVAGPFAVAACWRLSARRWQVRDLLAVFLVAQAAVHALAMAAPAPGAADDSRLLPMVAAHVLSAAVLVAAVRRGESVLWSLVRHVGLRASGLLDGIRAVPLTRAVPVLGELATGVPGPQSQVRRGRSPPTGRAPALV